MSSQVNKAVILARVSSKSQEDEGYSLDAQEKVLRDYAERKEYSVTKLFRIAETASKPEQRQIFQSLMKYVIERKIKIIVVEKVDRFVRNFKDVVMIDEWLEEDDSRQVHFVKDSIVLHKNSRSQEKLNWGIRVVIAKNYIDNLKEEVQKGIEAKLAAGWLPAKPPLGYKTIGVEGKREHVIDENLAPLIKKTFGLYLEPNYSVLSLTRQMDKLGLRTKYGKPLSHSHIHKMLTNPFYIGINRWIGVDYPGMQQPLIDKDVFYAVQSKITRKNPPVYAKHNPTYKNMFRCELCSGTITWEKQKNYWYGHCNGYKECPKKAWVREDRVEDELLDLFEALLCPSQAIMEWVQDALRVKHQKEMQSKELTVKRVREEHDRVSRMLDILYEDRLALRINTEVYDRKQKELSERQASLQIKAIEEDVIANKQFEHGMKILELTQQAATIYKRKPVEKKRIILSQLFSNLTINGQNVRYNYTELVEAIADKTKLHKQLLEKFERSNSKGDNSSRQELDEQLKTIWLGMRDSNPRSWDQNPVPYRLANPQSDCQIIPQKGIL